MACTGQSPRRRRVAAGGTRRCRLLIGATGAAYTQDHEGAQAREPPRAAAPPASLPHVSSRWSPEERLALVEALQARPGSQSETLFDAHGLGTDYRKPGKQSSKRAKINEALHAADRRGDLDEMLDAVALYLGESPRSQPAPKPTDFSPGANVVATDKRIFLSHATADKALADLLRDALILGGVPEDRIFYSSDRVTGIPSGNDIGTFLRNSLRNAGLIIELLSETFLTRPMCLMEFGAAWALGTPTYPIIVPPLTQNQVIAQIGNIRLGGLASDTEIDEVFHELHGRLMEDLEITAKVGAWNRGLVNFKEHLPSRLTAVRGAAAVAAPPPQVAAVAAATTDSTTIISISNVSIIDGPMGRELHAEATNHDRIEHSVVIKGTFYSSDGKIVGTADALVSQLRGGGTKTFSMSDLPDHARRKVEADTIL